MSMMLLKLFVVIMYVGTYGAFWWAAFLIHPALGWVAVALSLGGLGSRATKELQARKKAGRHEMTVAPGAITVAGRAGPFQA